MVIGIEFLSSYIIVRSLSLYIYFSLSPTIRYFGFGYINVFIFQKKLDIMQLFLEAVVVDLDEEGHVKGRNYDFSGLVMRLTGLEFDGVHFRLDDNGTSIDCVMEAEGGIILSDEINTNYPAPPNSPVKQISYKDPNARLTSNVLNKFMRRVNKEFPGHAILIRQVKGIQYDKQK